ncbi:MAG: LysM peptidoglycan-binding domain-containing protein [Planctomycetaceae bacterium]|nr:LysM peptidoglycan-binding domain-containing protein [Planctomycetaceae bacterium]
MHPDRKIGIAMGILLVGVVAALFFRNEPLATDEGLSADREQQLNERLRDRDVTVFLDEPDATDEAEEDGPQWSSEVLGSLTAREDEVPVPIGGPRLPDPTLSQDSTQRPGAPGGDAPANAESTQDVVVPQPAVDPAALVEGPSEPEYIEYTVQFGDTLSEISEKFLGSQTRFREIYEINRDRMQSPDRLRVGKAIRIPRSVH